MLCLYRPAVWLRCSGQLLKISVVSLLNLLLLQTTTHVSYITTTTTTTTNLQRYICYWFWALGKNCGRLFSTSKEKLKCFVRLLKFIHRMRLRQLINFQVSITPLTSLILTYFVPLQTLILKFRIWYFAQILKNFSYFRDSQC